MSRQQIGVLGATGLVGECLLQVLANRKYAVCAFSRQIIRQQNADVQWYRLTSRSDIENSSVSSSFPSVKEGVTLWICAAPIWVLPDYFGLLERSGAQRIVALSSTSRFTKDDSPDPAEQDVAYRLAEAEQRLQTWAEARGIEWIILRPTMVYGRGRDRNVTEIARLIRRWGIFPLLGEGRGGRQPVHVEDVAAACAEAIQCPEAKNHAFNLSGGEVLSYKKMVTQVFESLDKKPRFVRLPRWGFRLALMGLRLLPRFRHWSIAMAERMDRDMVFEHQEAKALLGFSPRSFRLEKQDLPLSVG